MAAMLVPLALTLSAAAQATIHVPQDQPTIQAGINAANNGDTVLVAPGTYVENIDFIGKSITVTSSGGAAKTMIDGGAIGPVVTFQSEEPRTAVLSGMTIQNAGGYGSNINVVGIAGVVVSNSSPTILNNTITQNQCWDVEILYGAPLIQGNEISATISPTGGCGDGTGAGIYAGGNLNGSTDGSDAAVIQGNTIENITIPASMNVTPGLTNLTYNNGGAGIAIYAGGPLIEGNILRNNSAPGGNGGAVNVAGASGATIAQNLIYGNSAGCGGGAISYLPAPFSAPPDPGTFLTIANNTIVDNSGGSSTVFTSCGEASQIYGTDFGISTQQVVIVNNIISSQASGVPAVSCELLPGSGAPNEFNQSIFDHNLLYNGGGTFFGPSCVDVSAKYGNIAAAPQFTNSAAGDFHFLQTSPGIDTGNNSALPLISNLSGATLATDFDGNARVQDSTGVGYPVIDMGAYEHAGTVDATPTTIELMSSQYTGPPGKVLTLFATLASSLGMPTGDATFFLDGKQIGSAPINVYGTAYILEPMPAAGTHSLYATYAGAGNFPPAQSVIILVDAVGDAVTGTYATTLNLYSNVMQQTYGQDVTFTSIGTSADPNTAFVPSPITLTLNHVTALTSLAPDNTGRARYTTNTLPVGADVITASYAGDATHQAATSSVTVQVNGFTTNMNLYCSPLTISVGGTAQLTAVVDSPSGTPVGPVIFSDNGNPLAVQDLINGTATLNYVGQYVGFHFIEAIYAGMDGYSKASAAGCVVPPMGPPPGIVVVGLPSSSMLSVSPPTGLFETTTNMTATVAPANPSSLPAGVGIPTGTVTFFNGTTTLGTAKLVAGVAAFSTVVLPVGTDPVTCVYNGDQAYMPSDCNTVAVTRTIAQPVLTITASADNIPALTPVSFTVQIVATGHQPPAGTAVTLSIAGQIIPLTLNANGTVTYADSSLLPGVYVVTANFAGSPNLLSASASLTETVVASPSTTVVSAVPSPGYVGQPINILAMVTAADALVPEGTTVTFFDGTTTIGTGTLDQSRTATLTTSSLAIGTHPLTASYPGGGPFLGSTSTVYNEMVLASSFTIALSPPTITVPADQAATVAIQLTSIGGFAGPLTLSYGTLPVNATASITPATVTLTAGGTGGATFTITTATQKTAASSTVPGSKPGERGTGGLPAIMAATLVLLLPMRKRLRFFGTAGRRGIGLLVWVVLSAAMVQLLSGCGNSFYILPGVAGGTYQIPITATDINQNKQTAVLTLVVPPQ